MVGTALVGEVHVVQHSGDVVPALDRALREVVCGEGGGEEIIRNCGKSSKDGSAKRSLKRTEHL